jgi:hypothetical protein
LGTRSKSESKSKSKRLLLHASIVGHSGYEPDTLDQAELRSSLPLV